MSSAKSKKYLIRKVTDYFGAFILAFLIVFIWQLYRSPIPLPFLKPYIVRALNHDSADYEVTVEEVNLELVRSIQPIKIIAKDVVYRKTDNGIVVKAPRSSISFSMSALMRGIISPSTVVVDRPTITIFTSYEEDKESVTPIEINEGKIGYYFDGFEEFLERFNSEDMNYPESYINEIIIKNAELEVHEVAIGRKWAFSNANYIFDRHGSYIELGLDAVLDLEDASVPFDFDVNFYTKTNNIQLIFSFADLYASEVVDNFLGTKTENYRVNLPISGKLSMDIDFEEILANKNKVSRSLDTAISNFNFEFMGGKGVIAFAGGEDFNYDVSSFMLRGSIDSGLENIKIDNAEFDLEDKKTTLGVDVQGVKKLILERSPEDIKIAIKADVERLALDDLSKYWPRYIAEDAWLWVEDSIYDGFVSDARFKFDFAYSKKDKAVVFQNLEGVGYINDASLDYLDGMPHVKNIYGEAVFSKDSIKINIDKGVSHGNIVTGGHVLLYDLNKYNNFIDIKLIAESSITDSLKLIDSPPFGYAKEMGLTPESFEGDAETDLGLKFELKKNLLPEEVNVSVQSNLKNVKIKNLIKDKIVSSDALKLSVTNKGLNVAGKIVLDDIKMDLEWRRQFAPPYKNDYRVSLMFDEALKKKLGIKTELLNEPYWFGNAFVIADIVETGNKMTANVRADLVESVIDYRFMGLVKNKGEVGKVDMKVELVDNKVRNIKDLVFVKDNFELKGNVTLDAKGDVKVVDIISVKGHKTDAKAKIEVGSGNKPNKINISGNSYDMSEFFADDKEKDARKGKSDDAEERLKKFPSTDVNIAVNSLWTNEYVPVTNFAGTANLRKGEGIHEIKLVGNYSYNKEQYFKFEYTPIAGGEYLINVDSSDAGSTLKVLHIYDNISGGTLNISGKRDKEEVILGHAKVRDFSIKNTNVLAKIMSFASLTGIFDMMTGNGVVFSHFDAPFTYRGGTLYIQEAKAFGNVLGITADGYYDFDEGNINIKGMIAPAYTLNRLLGRIPVVGTLLSGSVETVFAANYKATGSVDDADVSINPLSAISPNSIKQLFSN